MVPPKVIPACHSAAANGMFPTLQTKLMQAMTGPMKAFSTCATAPCPLKKRDVHICVGIRRVARPATINPATSSVRIIRKSPIANPAASRNDGWGGMESSSANVNPRLLMVSPRVAHGRTAHRRRIINAPPINSAAANCHPISTHKTSPSSMTRFVLANINTIAAVKSAPFFCKLLASPLAAYEHDDEITPKNDARAIAGAE